VFRLARELEEETLVVEAPRTSTASRTVFSLCIALPRSDATFSSSFRVAREFGEEVSLVAEAPRLVHSLRIAPFVSHCFKVT